MTSLNSLSSDSFDPAAWAQAATVSLPSTATANGTVARRTFLGGSTTSTEERPALKGCPPLPQDAYLDPQLAKDGCPWLEKYLAFSRRWAPRAFEGFHLAVVLWLLSTLIARRLVLDFGGKRYPSLYIMLCARTSMYTKTTVARIAVQILQVAGLDWLLLPDSMTPPKFLGVMSRQVPDNFAQLSALEQDRVKAQIALSGSRGWFYEEFGQKLGSIMAQNGVMNDFHGHLRRLDDGLDRYQVGTMARGLEVVDNPYLTFLANLTPADLRPYAGKGGALWNDGFFARFGLVAPSANVVRSRERFPEGERKIPGEILDPLVECHKWLGVPSVTIELKDSAGGTLDTPQAIIGDYTPKSCEARYRSAGCFLQLF